MHLNARSWQRLLIRTVNIAVFGLAIAVLLRRVFPFAHQTSRSLLIAVGITYIVAAYLLLPIAIRLGGFLTRRKRVPRYTSSVDGVPTDPVNIVIVGSLKQLKTAYADTGWELADPLTIRNSWRMIVSFIRNKPYPTAPFSSLYLFGRKQDFGFQKAIDGSPRKRHHVRYWALEDVNGLTNDLSSSIWHSPRPTEIARAKFWIGAGTRDTGFGFTQRTFQISHAVDSDTIEERDFMVAELKRSGMVQRVAYADPEHKLPETLRVNHFETDGRAAIVYLRKK